MEKYRVIGLMSGTSLDGLDIAACEFEKTGQTWSFKIHAATTIKYSSELKEKLQKAHLVSSAELFILDHYFGKFTAEKVLDFIKQSGFKPDFISSHGHTVFHQPDKGFTVQIGHGADIAAHSGFPVVCDFRSTDVAYKGQGAPLVPVGDLNLFKDYKYCVNLGGFANISEKSTTGILAFDVGPCNIVINELAGLLNLEMDKGGLIARKGSIDVTLLKSLNGIEYYSLKSPKSLAREWTEEKFMPLINTSGICIENMIATVTEHISIQIGACLKAGGKALFTGGGTFNDYLMERIKHYSTSEIIIPADEIIQFKEALVFAFLGVLRYRGEMNSLKEVTGAVQDSCAGAIYIA